MDEIVDMTRCEETSENIQRNIQLVSKICIEQRIVDDFINVGQVKCKRIPNEQTKNEKACINE